MLTGLWSLGLQGRELCSFFQPRGAIPKEARFALAQFQTLSSVTYWAMGRGRTWCKENRVSTAYVMAPRKHRDNRKVPTPRYMPHRHTLVDALPPAWPQLRQSPLLPGSAIKLQIHLWVHVVIRSEPLWSNHFSMINLPETNPSTYKASGDSDLDPNHKDKKSRIAQNSSHIALEFKGEEKRDLVRLGEGWSGGSQDLLSRSYSYANKTQLLT